MSSLAVKPDVSVVIPSHNEQDNLPTLVEEILAAEKASGRRFEIVVVDDQSSDDSWNVLLKLAARHPQIVAHRMEKQSGQSAALSAGFDVAKGAVVVTMDADLQNDAADIPKLLKVLEAGEADCAIGWRRDRRDPLSKKVISKVANGVRNWMTSETVKDTGCGLKAFRRECLDEDRSLQRHAPLLPDARQDARLHRRGNPGQPPSPHPRQDALQHLQPLPAADGRPARRPLAAETHAPISTPEGDGRRRSHPC